MLKLHKLISFLTEALTGYKLRLWLIQQAQKESNNSHHQNLFLYDSEKPIIISNRKLFDQIESSLHPLDIDDGPMHFWSHPDYNNFFRIKTKYSNVAFIYEETEDKD